MGCLWLWVTFYEMLSFFGTQLKNTENTVWMLSFLSIFSASKELCLESSVR